LHNDPATIRAFLRHAPWADRCGLYLVSPLLVLDPVERLAYQHLEYAPLVNPRAIRSREAQDPEQPLPRAVPAADEGAELQAGAQRVDDLA